MTKKEFAVFAAALKTYYSKEERLIPNEEAMTLWFKQLQDIPYNVAEAVLNKWVATNKWSPSIAEIREQATLITRGNLPDWSEGWKKTLEAIRRYGMYDEKKALDSLDPLTRETVERMGFRDLCLSETAMQDRANFRMIFERLAERERDKAQLPQGLVVLIEQMQSGGHKRLVD